MKNNWCSKLKSFIFKNWYWFFLFLILFIVCSFFLWFTVKMHNFDGTLLKSTEQYDVNNFDIQLFAVSGNETIDTPESGLNSINFNVDLFIFVITIVIISLVMIALIVAIIIICCLFHKRNKKIIIKYDSPILIDFEDNQEALDTKIVIEDKVN